jgi:hypothetical protein
MREAWRELMFADTDQAAKPTRDPVAPAQRSVSAQHKAASKLLDDERPAHRNTCRTPSGDADAPTFDLLTNATAQQQRAMALIQAIQL